MDKQDTFGESFVIFGIGVNGEISPAGRGSTERLKSGFLPEDERDTCIHLAFNAQCYSAESRTSPAT